MEADLARFYPGADLRDYWTRRTRKGRRALSFRALAVRVRHLPTDSACGRIGLDGSMLATTDHLLLVDVWEALTGKRHPMRPAPKEDPAVERKRAEKLAAARKRAQARREAIERGEIT